MYSPNCWRQTHVVTLSLWICGLLACGGRQTGSGTAVQGPAVRLDPALTGAAVEIARLEAARSFSGDRLARMATADGAPGAGSAVRVRAARALGRIGDAAAIATLSALIGDRDPQVRQAAARALGMAEADGAEQALTQRLASETDVASKRAILLALGQLGGKHSLPVLTGALADPAMQEAAATALGRFGRRSLALDSAARVALAGAASSGEVATRKAVAFALGREHEPDGKATLSDPDGVLVAVRALAGDADPEVRALAVRALARRGGDAQVALAALGDGDWRVRVEAVRALVAALGGKATARSSASADPGQLGRAFAQAVQGEWDALVADDFASARIQMIVAALPGVTEKLRDPVVIGALQALYRDADTRITQPARPKLGPTARLTISTVHCLAGAALVRVGQLEVAAVAACGGDPQQHGMPMAERRALLAELLAAGRGGPPAERMDHWSAILGHNDARVRAVAVAVIPRLLSDQQIAGDDSLRVRVLDSLRAAISDSAVEVAGSATDALGKLHGQPEAAAYAAGVVPALVQRGTRPGDNIELVISLMATIAKLGARDGEAACRSAYTHENRTMRKSARACFKALTGTDPGPGEPASAPTPVPVDVAESIGEKLFWKLVTDKGDIRIALYPKVAPWHIAAIVTLTRRGFYRDLTWHRVIGNFVAQGGDPDGSGWGGPDFSIPGEPSTVPYERGTVGIADAGLDTGGSQMFIAHSRLHHLDARYTVIGQVVDGQDVVDALIVGDRIKSAHIIVERHKK